MPHGGAAPWRFGAVSRLFVLWLAALVFAAGEARAQQGLLRGTVTDSTGDPVANADVSIVALRLLTRTNAEGQFSFQRLPRGELEVSVRRLGYRPLKLAITLTGNPTDSVKLTLAEQPAVLDEMRTSASGRRLRLAIEEFYRRRARGVGTFFTRDEIESRRARLTSDVLRTTPGVRFVRTRSGQGVRFYSSNGRRECAPMIWIDGQRAPEMEVDDIPVHDIEGLELYQGHSTMPMQFSPDNSTMSCGAIVVWSRTPGT